MNYLPTGFEGKHWNLANNWFGTLPVAEYNSRPIKYLEIGTLYGANLLTVSETYGKHPDSVLYCIDAWLDYTDYPEYKGEQPDIFATFNRNISLSKAKYKIKVNRGYSHVELQQFPDEFFDMIYIDGNHMPEFVLEDAVVSFRKLKTGGQMIFDDYCGFSPDLTMRGVNAFLAGYHNKIIQNGVTNVQLFVEKK